MSYKDFLGIDINVGDHIVYATTSGLRLGRVMELTTQNRSDYSKPLPEKLYTCEQYCEREYKINKRYYGAKATKRVCDKKCWSKNRHTVGRRKYQQIKIPALKVRAARRSWSGRKVEKMDKPVLVTTINDSVVVNGNLSVVMTLF